MLWFESLKDVLERFFFYWNERIVFEVLCGKIILIFVYGNSSRVFLKYLEGILDEDIINIIFFIGVFIFLELDENLCVVGFY